MGCLNKWLLLATVGRNRTNTPRGEPIILDYCPPIYPLSREWHLVIRFFAHLCLFLRVIGEEIPTPAVDIILNEYIHQLEVRYLSLHSSIRRSEAL